MATITSVVNKDIGAGLNAKEIAILAGAKVASERLTMSYIGNSSFESGLKKVGAGVFSGFLIKNRYARFAAAGVALDGFEDLVEATQEKFFRKKTNNNNNIMLV